MFELPRMKPSNVKQRSALDYGASVFSPDAGPVTTTYTSLTGSGFTMSVDYNFAGPSEIGEFMLFAQKIRYGQTAGQSGHMFFIPRNHPLWALVPDQDYIEELLTTKDIDQALWRMKGLGISATEVLNVNKVAFSISNDFG